jgi:erythromycin esterase-like protein/predicted phosphoribosyltransferase
MRYADRGDAGRQLASRLSAYAGRSDVIVLALPRGGVVVGFEVAQRLGVPLDVFLVRKLGVPGHPEVAMGAIASGGVKVLSTELIRELGIPQTLVEQVSVREHLELERRDRAYRGDREPPIVRDRTILLVDDGLATGATMQAAIIALRQLAPARIIIAVPVGARDTCARLAPLVDDLVCLDMPLGFQAVGLSYASFPDVSDAEVQRLLHVAAQPQLPRRGPQPKASEVAEAIRERVQPFTGGARDYDTLLHAIGDAQVVLLGEATHGTHEFYRERTLITRRLIAEKGFAGVAVEADWPDAYRVNRYVRGTSLDQEGVEALGDFRRFPTWMWRNAEVLDVIGWLRTYNDGKPTDARAGFYGLDLYSLHASMRAVLAYLEKVDPDAARRARVRYACFDRFGPELQQYGYATGVGLAPSCEREVITQLVDLQRARVEYASRDGRVAPDDFFYAEQNARLVKNAEAYYRSMFAGRVDSWNLRDRHMTDTLRALLAFLGRTQPQPRLVVWAHNSHLGDARATEMHEQGELNVGQLVREWFGAGAVLVGFTTYTGTVTAAHEWDAPERRRYVRPALAGSYERLFHDIGLPRFLAPLRFDPDLASILAGPRLERAIGVIYAPETERRSHYFRARLPEQFDFVIHIDQTRAVEPLDRTETWEAEELAETFPSGL